ncbi:nucleotidyltransferase family protein [Chitinolyticbacter meiyuanensis]|uniref:nucleotidyltransferase family protein n=1 Tax=Chitinolyticbacter meiyuanensis TaxID=682798 RepID=UPI001FE2B638|nr:nucleotidyltransferase family protein [Chitinolyticbacter meiyuanensis]
MIDAMDGLPDWRRTLLGLGSTIEDAIRCLDQSGLQIVLVIDTDLRLIGTLTDGDIRRAMLRGMGLTSAVDSIFHKQPLVAPLEMGRELVLQLMQINRIHQLPVVDANHHVVGLHIWDEILTPAGRSNLMVVMAGGKGTRLRPHTENCPKPMLEVGGKPMLEHILMRAKVNGFRRFIIAVHYLAHMVEEYFGDGAAWGIEIEYLREQSPLGTAGALGLLPQKPDEPFLVSNGDVLSDVNYGEMVEFHLRHQAAGSMAVRQYEIQNPFGVVKTNGVELVGFEEKPVYRSHINAGIYVLSPVALEYIVPGEHCDMPTLFSNMKAADEKTIVYPMHEPWLDVGRPDDLATARRQKH